jgi:hypothetical protein
MRAHPQSTANDALENLHAAAAGASLPRLLQYVEHVRTNQGPCKCMMQGPCLHKNVSVMLAQGAQCVLSQGRTTPRTTPRMVRARALTRALQPRTPPTQRALSLDALQLEHG